METRQKLVDELQRLMIALGTASAATRPTPWLNLDLSMPQLKAMMVLHHRGRVRVGEVAQALSLSPNGTTSVLDRLEHDDLVRRLPDPSDRRAVLVQLTDTGTTWITDLLSANARDFGELLRQLSDADLEALHQGMMAIARVLRNSPNWPAATAGDEQAS